jgi:hypothetical protein
MSDRKRTTVTIIETHEVWIIRRAVPELSEVEVLTPDGIVEPLQIPRLRELNNCTETNEPSEEEES